MKLFSISAEMEKTRAPVMLFVLAETEDSALRIAEQGRDRPFSNPQIVQSADAVDGLPPRIIAVGDSIDTGARP